ncbi:DsrE family protein [Arenibaculum pallidiluteum]|uniref:DsrE family protein n=1 Tax=Arenibaculum pallidiluteum TaxID=2812559 RepID=UPI001A962DFD|nr:DsrE family protein [Arenibaculum pallidiluteum]
MPGPDKLSLVVFSGGFERVHYALVMASAAAASNRKATLFFTGPALRALVAEDDGAPGWHRLAPAEDGTSPALKDAAFRELGVAGFEELLEACVALGVTVMVCEMGLRAQGLEAARLRPDVPVQSGGVVTLLNDASDRGGLTFI